MLEVNAFAIAVSSQAPFATHRAFFIVRLIALILALLLIIWPHAFRQPTRIIASKDRRTVGIAFLLVLCSEILGRFLFYASYNGIGK